MEEEYVYDRRRIFMVLIIAGIILGSVFIASVAWPRSAPKIEYIQTDSQVINNVDQIEEWYSNLFSGSTIDASNSTLYRIDAIADEIYFMSVLIFTVQVDQDTNMYGIAITQKADESFIYFGQNNIPVEQKLFTRSIQVGAGDYSMFIFLDTFNADFSVNCSVRMS